MSDGDGLYRFLFENAGVRGELVHLDASWRAISEGRGYPLPVRTQLGQAMAASALLSTLIKFEGSLILQVQGNGPLTTLVAQATHERTLRGLARWQDEVTDGTLSQTFGDGRIVLTISPKRGERYQGIVPLQGDKLEDALETYFHQSEQLETRLWLAADGDRAAGLLIQVLPAEPGHEDDWQRLVTLADTVTADELLGLPAERLLYRLFNEERVRLFEPDPFSFRCGCSQERISDSLRALGRDELEQIIEEQGVIDVNCDFCNRNYRFDAVDVEQLLIQSPSHDAPSTTQ